MTFINSTEQNSGEQQTLFAADFPVSRSAKPESKLGETMNDISFRKCFELFQKSDRVGSSLKTFADCLVTNLDKYSPKLSHHWKAKATKSLRFVFLLQPSKPRTGEIGYGLLPTVRATEYKNPRGKTGNRSEADSYKAGWTLSEKIALLPTPTTNDVSEGANPVKIQNGRFIRDAGTIEHSANLQSIIQSLPTPVARDYKDGNQKSESKGRNPMTNNLSDAIEVGANLGSPLQLQPAFVEWMMGFPTNWTSLEVETIEPTD